MIEGSPTRELRGKAQRRYQLGTRRTTRAHLALARRPSFRADAEVTLQAACAAIGQQLGCPVSAASALLDSDVRLPRSVTEGSAFLIVELAPRDARAAVEVDRAFLSAVLDRLSGGAGKPAPATRMTQIEEVAFGFLGMVALSAVRAQESLARRFGPRLLAVVDSRDEVLARLDARQSHVAIEVQLTVGGSTGVARILVPALALQAAIQDVPVQVDPQVAPQVLAAALPVTPILGRTRLDLADAMGLGPGDVVVFDQLGLRGGVISGECRLIGPEFALFGRLSEQGFTFTGTDGRALPRESRMSVKSPEQTLTSLPVDVEIELTRLKLTLSELSCLKPGSVLPLRINAAEPVVLRVGDRAVARAELVEIENEVGARILHLLPER